MVDHENDPGALSRPLSGLVVIDLSRVLSGPYCTMMLCDLGATVIKVEQPGVGDEARHFLPVLADGRSAYFTAINRGKKSIALDLANADDRAVFDGLVKQADVLVENFRPGVLSRLGYDFEVLKRRHPRLILASISGFGQTGPYRSRAAYDVIVQAMSGMMSITGHPGHPGQPPSRSGSSMGDLGAALFACNGIQAALLQRVRTGEGCHVDVSMLESQIALMEGAIPHVFCTGASPAPTGARHPGSAPFDAFEARDGYLVIAAGSDHLFGALLKVLERPGWALDERFATRALRVANHAALKEAIEQVLSMQSVAHWLARLDEAGIPSGPINDVMEMMDDPQVLHRGVLAEIESSGGQRAPMTPILLSQARYGTQLPRAPDLDEHRAEIIEFAKR